MFRKRALGSEMAFGVIPAYCRYELYMERYRHPAEFLNSHFPNGPLTVLDIGSGRGRLKQFLNGRDGVRFHGIEVLAEMARTCSDLGYQMHMHDIDAAPLPFPEDSFDVVAGLHVLEHLRNPAEAVQEMVRVTRIGGLIVLGVPTKLPLVAELLGGYYRARQALQPIDGRTCKAYSVRSFIGLLRQTLGDTCHIHDVRGFRVFSARKRLPLENSKHFYLISTAIGKAVPSITPEINVILERRGRVGEAPG